MYQFIKNIIGFISFSGRCFLCGNSLFGSNSTIDYGDGHGRCICDKCFKEKNINEENRRRGAYGVEIKDENCKHEWERSGVASFYCKKCNSVMAISCSHGGSIACEKCSKEWGIENGVKYPDTSVRVIDLQTHKPIDLTECCNCICWKRTGTEYGECRKGVETNGHFPIVHQCYSCSEYVKK